jgi:hypothetical protein
MLDSDSCLFLVIDFDMSDAQQEHTLAIQHLAPRLAALRIELCPCHMTESYFWKVYFVLLHSRLKKHDADNLSTPQVNCFVLFTIFDEAPISSYFHMTLLLFLHVRCTYLING